MQIIQYLENKDIFDPLQSRHNSFINYVSTRNQEEGYENKFLGYICIYQ